MPAVEAGDVVWRIGADMSDLNGAIAQAQNNIQRGFEAASRQVGIAMTAMGAAITGALAVSANAAIDWETAFTGVLKTVDGTEIEMAALADGIRDMAKEIPVAATELAAFAEIGGQMGVPRDQILGFTKVIAILAETTNIAGEEGAAMLAHFATVAQVPQSEYSSSLIDSTSVHSPVRVSAKRSIQKPGFSPVPWRLLLPFRQASSNRCA